MVVQLISRRLAIVGGVVLLVACSDHSENPTAVAPDAAHAAHFMNATTSNVSTLSLEPFTFRAPLDPYRIQQLPDFQVHSKTRSDIVLQRSVFAPGAGPWHTHPGPSFVYVIEGSIKLDRFSEKTGCTETQVYGAGAAYFEIANEVHRAVVVSSESAVLLVTRFNIPVGSPITIPAADPGC
jgi:quercetin dioxygenase-like cupin family protein